MDGNFKVSPTIFSQLYVIGAKLNDGAISCIYAFLPWKEQQMYNEMKLNRQDMAWNVRTVNCDFQMCAHNAMWNVFGVNICVVFEAVNILKSSGARTS